MNKLIVIFFLAFGIGAVFLSWKTQKLNLLPSNLVNSIVIKPLSIPSPTPTSVPVEETKTTFITNPTDSVPWGQVIYKGNHEYEGHFGNDNRMATPQEIFNQVNLYRQEFGKPPVTWNNDLANWAQTRANLTASNMNFDGHAGYLSEDPGEKQQLHYYQSEEEATESGPLLAVHIIEWQLAADTEHREGLLYDVNALGVGVASNGTYYATDLIFAKF